MDLSHTARALSSGLPRFLTDTCDTSQNLLPLLHHASPRRALSLSLFYTIEPSTQLPLVSPKLHRGSTRPNSNGRERHRWHTSGDFSLLCLSMLISICEGRKHISHTWRGHRHFPITKPAFAPHKHFTGTVSNRWISLDIDPNANDLRSLAKFQKQPSCRLLILERES